MSVYKVYLKWKDKDITLAAKSLDLTHPYFVSIKDLIFKKESSVIINPADDDIRKEFGNAKNLMIPFQSVTLIEELDASALEPDYEKVKSFPHFETKET